MFLKVPNELFSYKLKPSAFIVYIYLSSIFYWKKSIKIKLETIARKCHMSINTAQTAVNELTTRGLLHKTECYINHRRVTNEYKVTKLSGGFAMIEKNILKLELDNRAFMILCYIYNRANQSLKSYPSISEIHNGTGLGRTTIISKVRLLQGMGLLCKERYVCLKGDYGHNNHTLIRLTLRVILFNFINKILEAYDSLAQSVNITKKIFRLKRIAHHVITKIIILFTFIKNYLNTSRFFNYRVVQILGSVLKTHLSTVKSEKENNQY